MLYDHLTDDCTAARIGEGGLSNDGLERALEEADFALERLRARHAEQSLALLALPHKSDDLDSLAVVAERYRKAFKTVYILGTGGSSLGGRTLCALADQAKDRPVLHFLEGLDPHSAAGLLAAFDPKASGLIVVSKSGGTAETMAQFMVLRPRLEAALGRAGMAQAITVITEPTDNPLRRMATRHGLPTIEHDPGVGGRFSVLSNVGLLPAMILGLDGAAVRRGAAGVLDHALSTPQVRAVPPALGAALAVGLLNERHISQSVLFFYIERLADFGLWYRQLWAESLGKDGTGTTPIQAMGPVDQHSQLQLYLAGPRDKIYSVLTLDVAGQGPRIDPAEAADPAFDYLSGRHFGDLLEAMSTATAETLAKNGHPVRRFRIERLDEEVLGALLMHFMLETIITADMMGLNAFDQPAVEEGKILARQILTAARPTEVSGELGS